jgi:hypothetical protein
MINTKDNKENSIEFERSELRYIFYVNDLSNLINDFKSLGFHQQEFKDSPITQTIYFGSKRGLQPGVSIKARIYTNRQFQNFTEMEEDTLFNLVEIKSTVGEDEVYLHGKLDSEKIKQNLILEDLSEKVLKDIVFRIQRISEDGLLRDSTIKVKSRLKREDVISEDENQLQNLTLKEIVILLCKQSKLDEKLSFEIKSLLNNKIRPFFYKSLVPFFMTQYARIHLVPNKPELQNFIRVTIDPGVEYYETNFESANSFLNQSKIRAEFITREPFCRLEFKIDPVALKQETDLDVKISEIMRQYGCIAYVSKKWSGVTLVSERHIEKLAFWREQMGATISGYFPVEPSWFSYDTIYSSILEGFLDLIKHSKIFVPFEKEPRVLVKNHNFITGILGVPNPSLVITIEGPNVIYNLPPKSYPVKLNINQPEFYIIEDSERPIRSISISSKAELDQALHPSIRMEGDSFFRSYGFLVMHKQTHRIYKLTLERKIDLKGNDLRTEQYCKMRYIGSHDCLYNNNQQEIYNELLQFYEEFAIIMNQPVKTNLHQ